MQPIGEQIIRFAPSIILFGYWLTTNWRDMELLQNKLIKIGVDNVNASKISGETLRRAFFLEAAIVGAVNGLIISFQFGDILLEYISIFVLGVPAALGYTERFVKTNKIILLLGIFSGSAIGGQLGFFVYPEGGWPSYLEGYFISIPIFLVSYILWKKKYSKSKTHSIKKTPDVSPKEKKVEDNHITIGEKYWKWIVCTTITTAAIGISIAIVGVEQINNSYNTSEKIQNSGFNDTEIKDTFPDFLPVRFVNVYFENDANKLILYKNTVFDVTFETTKEYKNANFEIFQESESKRFGNSTSGPIKQADGSLTCPHIAPWRYERAFSIPMKTGGASGDNPTFVYSGTSYPYKFTVPGNYKYQISLLTDDSTKNNCTLITYQSKVFFTIPDEQTLSQSYANEAIQKQNLEQKQNDLRSAGFSYLTFGAILLGFSITLLPIILNKRISTKHRN